MGIEVANNVVAALFGSNGVLTNTAAAYNPEGNIFGVQRVAREAGREVLKERLPAPAGAALLALSCQFGQEGLLAVVHLFAVALRVDPGRDGGLGSNLL